MDDIGSARGTYAVSVQIKTLEIPETCPVCTICEAALVQLIFMQASDQHI
jgi:hypothetical protein